MTRMQPSIPHVRRVRRLLNMWMRRRDPAKVLRGLPDLFPRAELALLLLPLLNCFPRKTWDWPLLQTGPAREFLRRDIKAESSGVQQMMNMREACL